MGHHGADTCYTSYASIVELRLIVNRESIVNRNRGAPVNILAATNFGSIRVSVLPPQSIIATFNFPFFHLLSSLSEQDLPKVRATVVQPSSSAHPRTTDRVDSSIPCSLASCLASV